jgi:hypothetical protein
MGLFVVSLAGLASTARAVVVRGYMTDAYGKPLSGGQVRLMQAGTAVAVAFVGPDGAFGLREGLPCWASRGAICRGLGKTFTPGL